MRYEVDRIRNGRSFCTRRVVARQSIGAILNLEASFQVPEDGPRHRDGVVPARPAASWRAGRHLVDADVRTLLRARRHASRRPGGRDGVGWRPGCAWCESLDDRPDLHPGGLAYLSDDLPTDAVVRAHPLGVEPEEVLHQVIFTASLDHTIWFHRPLRVDRWHLTTSAARPSSGDGDCPSGTSSTKRAPRGHGGPGSTVAGQPREVGAGRRDGGRFDIHDRTKPDLSREVTARPTANHRENRHPIAGQRVPLLRLR